MNSTQEAAQPFTILVVDREHYAGLYLKQVLEKEGYQVLTALKGAEGIQIARRMRPDLILCDVSLPDLTGQEVIKRLQQDPELACIPCILMRPPQAEGRHGRLKSDKAEAVPFGHALLTRPVDPQALLGVVRRQQVQQSVHRQQANQGALATATQGLREPLTTMRVAIEMLTHSQTEAQRQHYLAILQEQWEKEADRVNRLDSIGGVPSTETTTFGNRPLGMAKTLQIKHQQPASGRSRSFQMRVPEELLQLVDEAVSYSLPTLSRNSWILQAMREKLERDNHL